MRTAWLAAPLLLLGAAPALADVTADSSFGYDGTSVPGAIAPLRVELASSEKTPIRIRVEVRPRSNMGGITTDGLVHSVEVFLAPGAKKRIVLPVLPHILSGGEWTLTLEAERRTFLRHGTLYADGRTLSVPVGSNGSNPSNFQFSGGFQPIVGVLGDPARRCAWMGDESRYNDTGDGSKADRDRKTASGYVNMNGIPEIRPPGKLAAALPHMILVSPESAPDSWLCYEGFDALLWVDPDPDALKDAARLDALLEFAACGGRLVVALTPASRVSPDSPLSRALPAEASGHDDLKAGDVLAGAGGALIPVARLGRIDGRVDLATADGRPLVVSQSHGLGTVVVLAFDPRHLTAVPAASHAQLLHLAFGAAVHVSPEAQNNQYSQGSIEPVVNHLRKRFLSTPPMGLLVLGLILYVAAIGPVDYFLLKRKGKLRRTVVTFPLIVVGFTALAYGSSFLLFGGTSGQARVAWLDFATSPGKDSDVVRGLDLTGAYSPTGTTLPVAYESPRSFLGAPWVGSGGSWGGNESSSLDGTVVYGADGRPQGAFELPLRAFRTVQARFSGEVPLSLDARMKGPAGARVLAIRNGLSLRIRDLCVVKGNRILFPGDLSAGGALDVDLAKGSWQTVGGDPRTPDPFGSQQGFFGQGEYGRYGRPSAEQFVPVVATEEAAEAARVLMGRAALGVSLAGLSESAYPTQIRALARQGLDLTRQAREGRILVMGWCDGDPVGVLPRGQNMKSSVVVVRRVLPAEGAQ